MWTYLVMGGLVLGGLIMGLVRAFGRGGALRANEATSISDFTKFTRLHK